MDSLKLGIEILRKIHHKRARLYTQMWHYLYGKTLGSFGDRSYIDKQASLRGHLENIFIGNEVCIHQKVVISCESEQANIRIGDQTLILENAMLMAYGGNITIGHHCSVHPFCVLYGQGGLSIGNYVRIATHTVIVPANHNFEDPDTCILHQGSTKKGIVIEDDVWIGAGVKILDGCHIGKGSVIGAGTVVTKNVEPYSVVVGCPGRVIRKRGHGEAYIKSLESNGNDISMIT